MIEEALDNIKDQDSYAAIEYLITDEGDERKKVNGFNVLTNQLYWEEKDLDASIAMGRAGIQYGIMAALQLEQDNPKLAHNIRTTCRAIAINLASFTWKGWDEVGIDIEPSHCLIGLDAAKAALRLSEELDENDLLRSRCHWTLGAQWLSAGELEKARDAFLTASNHAKAANEPGETLLSLGFHFLARLLVNPNDADALEKMNKVKKKLKDIKGGRAFAFQIDTAEYVFQEANV
jgi:hypothetical protein